MLNKPNLWLLLSVQSVCCFFVRYTPVVEVSQGKLRGFQGLNGMKHYFGIPYAVSKRFEKPKPPLDFKGVFDAVFRYNSCAQAVSIFQFGKEDCLNLDIYAPGNNYQDQKLPVLVFFHGGSYFYGSKWHYNPEFLVKKNIIVVIVNYRLGVLGFMCVNNIANLGLKDQVAALMWIQKNIAVFGGDPDNVIISGQSAGSATASMHLLSKKSEGLFHKAILMSGIALTPWAFNVDPLTPTFEDASKIQPVSNESDIYKTFLKAPLSDLLTVTLGQPNDFKYFKYAPCVDSNFTEPFFHNTPYETIKSGVFNKVPIIVGFTDLEGLLFYSLNNQSYLNYLEDNFVERLPALFSWCSDKDKKRIASKIRMHYFGNRKISSATAINGAIEMYSDWAVYATFEAFSKLLAKYSDKPVYNYMFSYEGERNFAKFIFNRARGLNLKGATHIDDLFYVYKPGGITLPLNNASKLMVEKFTTMLSNFMKYGDPTPSENSLLPVHWPPTTANKSQLLRIDEPLSVTDTPAHVRGQFLLSVLCEHGLSGYVPCDSAMHCNLQK